MARAGDPRVGARYQALKAWAKGHFLWVCVYCQMPIPTGMHDTRWGCTLAHNIPVSERPDLAVERSNLLGLAHRGCNRTAWALEHYHGTTVAAPATRSEDW